MAMSKNISITLQFFDQSAHINTPVGKYVGTHYFNFHLNRKRNVKEVCCTDILHKI